MFTLTVTVAAHILLGLPDMPIDVPVTMRFTIGHVADKPQCDAALSSNSTTALLFEIRDGLDHSHMRDPQAEPICEPE